MTDHEVAILYVVEAGRRIVAASQMARTGILRRSIDTMIQSGRLYRAMRGVFSNETALHFYQLTDRTPMR